MVVSARWPYGYSNLDSISLLFARGFFHSSNDLNPLVPYSQINFPVAIVCWLADLLGPLRNVVLWAAQAFAVYLMLHRFHQFAMKLLPPAQSLFALIVVLLHPFVWTSMLFAPNQVVTAWLALEALIQIINTSTQKGNASKPAIFLFALSFCGSNGYFWALSLGILAYFTFDKNKQHPSTLKLIVPIFPATFFYLILSLTWGVLGGAYLSNSPSLWQPLGWTALISGHWTQQAQSILLWMSKGGVGFPSIYLLFGLIALLGVYANTKKNGLLPKFFFVTLLIHIALSAFSSLSVFQSFALFPVLFFTILLIRGAAWLSDQLHIPILQSVLTFLFTLSLLAIAFFELQPHWEKARFYQFISSEAETIFDERGSHAALQFSPNVFVNLPNAFKPQPIGIHWRLQYKQTSFVFPPPTIEQAIQQTYDWIGFYAPFSSSQTNVVESEQGPLLEPLLSRYEIDRRGNLLIWQRNNEKTERTFAMAGEPIGAPWDFEHEFKLTHQIGAAFGLEPDTSQSAVGFTSAGPGSDDATHLMGSISSEPFIIESDELHFYADIPKSSTQTFFALAIQSESELNKNTQVKETKHLYDRTPGEALMDDTFFYIEPSQLAYTPSSVSGWRVVRVLQEYPQTGWQKFEWATGQWKGLQAMWLAADRDANATFRIDHIQQWNRPPGRYWNFESGTYAQWQAEGEAFGNAPVVKAIGAQTDVSGHEGNFFINSFRNGSDAATGRLLSEPVLIEFDQLTFHVGGGDDLLRTFVGLEVGGEYVLRASGERSESLREVVWDLTPWQGKTTRIIIEDQSSGAWGHILADDFKLTNG